MAAAASTTPAAVRSDCPAPRAPYTRDPHETSLCVWWQASSPSDAPATATGYRLLVREFPKPWATATIVDVPLTQTEHVASGLSPTSTYEFKLAFLFSDGSTSPCSDAVAADTLAAGCVPKDEKEKQAKGQCVLQ